MASWQAENRVADIVTKLLVNSMMAVVLCLGSVVYAQEQGVQQSKTNESLTAASQVSGANTNPSRTTESHNTSGDRRVDKLLVEVVGLNGTYQPDYEFEKETVQINAETSRTVERTYRWDLNGQRNLAQVTEEEARSSASGDSQKIRTTSSPDLNGKLYITQREITDTRKSSPNAQETETTFYVVDANGGSTLSLKTQEIQERSPNHTVAVKKTTLAPDINGNLQIGEITESVIKEDGKDRSSEERVLRIDSMGKLSEGSRTISKETKTAAGETSNTVEAYSTEIPGLAVDGSLHLNRRVTTVQKDDSAGKTTEQQTEELNLDDPRAGLQVRTNLIDIVHYGASGMQQTKTIQARDVNGNWNVVSVETRKSDQTPAK
jgi:hypothetical protein